MSELLNKNPESLPEEALEGVNGGLSITDPGCTGSINLDFLSSDTDAVKAEKMRAGLFPCLRKNDFVVVTEANRSGD